MNLEVIENLFALRGNARWWYTVFYLLLLANYGFMSAINSDYSWRHRRSHIHGSSEDKANSIIGVGKTNHAFLTPNGTRVQAQSGGSATLPCTLKRSSQGTVTWIRRSDFHLLTVGNAIYSSDERFHIEHVRHLGHWPLKIKSVKLEDAGTYECQISTHPPASIFVHLEVVEAFAEIQGSPDLHIRSGSTLRLVCSIKGAIERPSYVFWYHSGRMVNYDIDLGFIVRDEKDVSLLTVPEANKSMHDGNYTCAPSNARPASIAVHILNGEMPAAMQHANTSSGSSRNLSSYKITISMLCMYIFIYTTKIE